jgi:hypothetical protein
MKVTARLPDGSEESYTFAEGTSVGAAESRKKKKGGWKSGEIVFDQFLGDFPTL